MELQNSDLNSYIYILYYQSNNSYYFTLLLYIKIRLFSWYRKLNIT